MTTARRPWYTVLYIQVFCTVVHGIGSMRDLKKVGRVGVKTLFYFEAVSTLALVRSSKTSPSDAGAYAR